MLNVTRLSGLGSQGSCMLCRCDRLPSGAMPMLASRPAPCQRPAVGTTCCGRLLSLVRPILATASKCAYSLEPSPPLLTVLLPPFQLQLSAPAVQLLGPLAALLPRQVYVIDADGSRLPLAKHPLGACQAAMDANGRMLPRRTTSASFLRGSCPRLPTPLSPSATAGKAKAAAMLHQALAALPPNCVVNVCLLASFFFLFAAFRLAYLLNGVSGGRGVLVCAVPVLSLMWFRLSRNAPPGHSA